MSADRELLALAAKAAGINCRWWKVRQWKERAAKYGKVKYSTGTKDVFGTHHAKPWNPLADGGEALNLSAFLKIDIYHGSQLVETFHSRDLVSVGVIAEYFADETHRAEAMRRAIVRAAAEIGKAMP